MAKEIQYPTQDWVDGWLDKYEAKHPGEKLNYDALREQAESEWWDAQIDKGNPTPFDLTKEQEKDIKKMLGNAHAKRPANYSLEGKKPRERKPNDEKRTIIRWIKTLFEGLKLNGEIDEMEILNVEKEISFKIGENQYSLTLICHRKPKN